MSEVRVLAVHVRVHALNVPAATLAWLDTVIGNGAEVLRVAALPQASHTNHRVVFRVSSGSERSVLLRQFTDAHRLGTDPWYEPKGELDALGAIASLELPVPRLVGSDVEARECDVPTLVLTWLPGSPSGEPTDIASFVRKLAEPLPTIHAGTIGDGFRAFEPYFRSHGVHPGDLHVPKWSTRRSLWERLLEEVAHDPPDGRRSFIHRDYHHGNTLWRMERLTGIVDWTTGCVGPSEIDVAHMRLNLACDFGIETADAFFDVWRAIAGGEADFHPYWDLLCAADWLIDGGPDDDSPSGNLDRYEAFVARALAELG